MIHREGDGTTPVSAEMLSRPSDLFAGEAFFAAALQYTMNKSHRVPEHSIPGDGLAYIRSATVPAMITSRAIIAQGPVIALGPS